MSPSIGLPASLCPLPSQEVPLPCSLGQVLSEDPVRKGWGPAKDTVTAVLLLPAGSQGARHCVLDLKSGVRFKFPSSAHHW